MRLATPDCPVCRRSTVDRGDRFECTSVWACDHTLPVPAEWYREAAGELGLLAVHYTRADRLGHASPFFAYVEARAAASFAMRACPELRQ